MGLYPYHVNTVGSYLYQVNTVGLYPYQVNTVGSYPYQVNTVRVYPYHVNTVGLYPYQSLVCALATDGVIHISLGHISAQVHILSISCHIFICIFHFI